MPLEKKRFTYLFKERNDRESEKEGPEWERDFFTPQMAPQARSGLNWRRASSSLACGKRSPLHVTEAWVLGPSSAALPGIMAGGNWWGGRAARTDWRWGEGRLCCKGQSNPPGQSASLLCHYCLHLGLSFSDWTFGHLFSKNIIQSDYVLGF